MTSAQKRKLSRHKNKLSELSIEENSEEEKDRHNSEMRFPRRIDNSDFIDSRRTNWGQMDQVKKMILVDPRMFERLNSVNDDIRVKLIMDKMTNAKDVVLSSLDSDMSNILIDPYLTDDKKVQRYFSAQTRYNLTNAPASRDESAENGEKRIPRDLLIIIIISYLYFIIMKLINLLLLINN